jgi:hypothetical protein
MLTYAHVCSRMLTKAHVRRAYADVCWRMLTYGSRMLTNAHVRRSYAHVRRSYADVCWRMLTYADVFQGVFPAAADSSDGMRGEEFVSALDFSAERVRQMAEFPHSSAAGCLLSQSRSLSLFPLSLFSLARALALALALALSLSRSLSLTCALTLVCVCVSLFIPPSASLSACVSCVLK